MNQPNKEKAVKELIEVSKKLLSNARIFYLEKIQSLMKRRIELVSIIWDVPDGESLDSYSEKYGINPPAGLSISAKDREELQLLDRELRTVLNHHLSRINSEKDLLRNGRRVINNVRNVYSKQEVNRFNRYG